MRLKLYLSILAEPPLLALLAASLVSWIVLFAIGDHMHSAGHNHDHMHMATIAIGPLLTRSAWPWFVMVLAMMSPLQSHAIRHLWVRSLTRRRWRAIFVFAVGYLAVWIVVGAVFVLSAELLNMYLPASVALLVGVVLAVVWQASPWKQHGLNRCHYVARLSAFGIAADKDCLRYGVVKGSWCVSSCWALMFVPLVAGSFGMALMLLVTVYLFIEHFQSARPAKWRLPFVSNLPGNERYWALSTAGRHPDR
jgi:predicted metal-binding membrane protein